MIGKAVFILALVLVVTGGLLAGEYLRGSAGDTAPLTAERAAKGGQADSVTPAGAQGGADDGHVSIQNKDADRSAMSYYRFPTQFFVPVMHGDRLDGMMVLTLTVEMPESEEEEVYRHEYRLRDALLRSLMIHANTGGFDGNFTLDARLRRLRESLLAAATGVTEGLVTDVLIEDIARQNAS
ncbi:hypothetical protein [Paracoccus albus]|uniref:hypothetical protein n=1 Tax=Paracoccus albus TaxID=3017784 RepID=UPI0022F0FF74|nr:hypothetical protein [Paracoccus albus]WBU59790.1 hypothetical protein PAF20_13685 [Paracoccus albus]